MTYRISCAGCSTIFRFRSLERIGIRVRQHRCWETKVSQVVESAAERSRGDATEVGER